MCVEPLPSTSPLAVYWFHTVLTNITTTTLFLNRLTQPLYILDTYHINCHAITSQKWRHRYLVVEVPDVMNACVIDILLVIIDDSVGEEEYGVAGHGAVRLDYLQTTQPLCNSDSRNVYTPQLALRALHYFSYLQWRSISAFITTTLKLIYLQRRALWKQSCGPCYSKPLHWHVWCLSCWMHASLVYPSSIRVSQWRQARTTTCNQCLRSNPIVTTQ